MNLIQTRRLTQEMADTYQRALTGGPFYAASWLLVGIYGDAFTRAPMISWGLLLNAAQNIQNLGSYPWVLAPVVGVLIAVMSFNMLGDGLRDAIDPYQH